MGALRDDGAPERSGHQKGERGSGCWPEFKGRRYEGLKGAANLGKVK